MAAALLTVRCDSDPEWSGVSISGPDEWLGASGVIDGRDVGKLQNLMLHDTIVETWLKKQHGDSPMFHIVGLNIPFKPGARAASLHKVRIEKTGRDPVEGEFTYPDPRGSSVQFLFINGRSLDNSAGPDAHGSHP